MPPSVDKCHLRAPCVHARHPLRGQAAAFLFRVHKNTPIRGQVLPPGTVRPRQAPSPWTGGCISLPRPQKHPQPWTKVTSRHRTSTPGTLCVDRRLHFSSASTKTPPSVDKSHLQAPYVHTRHHLCGQVLPPGTGHLSCHGIPAFCDKCHSGHPICHRIHTICDKYHFRHPICHEIPFPCDKYHFRHPICHEIPASCDKCHSGASLLRKIRKQKRLLFPEAFSVIRLGLEPRTPTLKVLCSTC